MNLIRIVFLGLAVLLPATWTIAKAGDDSSAETKTTKKTKKSKKGDGTTETKTETDKKTDSDSKK